MELVLPQANKFDRSLKCYAHCPLRRAGNANKGGISLFKKEISLPYTLPEKISIASEQLKELQCLPIALPTRGGAALGVAKRFASASIIRCCAAVGGFAALRMRHTPCGCRSAHLVEVLTNFRLPRHCSMRRAQQSRYFARSLPPDKRHSRLTIVRRGCDLSRIAEIHGEAMYTAPDCAARAALRAALLQWRGQGAEPLAFSWGSKGAILSRERMAPLSASPCTVQGNCNYIT